MFDRAAGHLVLGRSVVLDATWLEPRRRAEAETVAADANAELVHRTSRRAGAAGHRARPGGRGIDVTNCIDRYGQPAGPAAESWVFH